MHRYKLLQLNVTANWGSTGKIAEGIGQAAMVRGWESAVAYGRMMNRSQSKLIKVGNQADVYLHYARHRFFDGEGLGSRNATKQLIEQINAYAPDIIHLHNLHDHWLNYPLLFEYLGTVDTPVVWTFHDCWAFTGGCAHFESSDCEKWTDHNCSGRCPQYKGWLVSKRERNFRLKHDLLVPISKRMTIVGVSDWITGYASKSFLKDCKFTTIHNGIDVGTFIQSNSSKESLILGVSNVWPPYKGLQDFIALRQKLPDDVKIILVGLTKRQIESLPMGITGMERTKNIHELVDLYSRASVFVNPTHNDTFPTVNLEALACGTPVVTYRTGGSPEAIDEDSGIVVEKGDVKSLSNAIMDVLGNPNKYRSDACRKRAALNFNKDIQFDKYIDLYESILS